MGWGAEIKGRMIGAFGVAAVAAMATAACKIHFNDKHQCGCQVSATLAGEGGGEGDVPSSHSRVVTPRPRYVRLHSRAHTRRFPLALGRSSSWRDTFRRRLERQQREGACAQTAPTSATTVGAAFSFWVSRIRASPPSRFVPDPRAAARVACLASRCVVLFARVHDPPCARDAGAAALRRLTGSSYRQWSATHLAPPGPSPAGLLLGRTRRRSARGPPPRASGCVPHAFRD